MKILHKILSTREKRVVDSAVSNLKISNFHYTDAPVDRKIILEKKRLWVYWLKDFCPITRQWFQEGLKKIPSSLKVDDEVSYLVDEIRGGIVILKFRPQSAFTKTAFHKKIFQERENYLSPLLERYNKNSDLLAKKILDCESKNEGLEARDISKLFNLLTTFVSIAPEKIFPYKKFEQVLKNCNINPQLQQAIFYSSRSGYKETYREFLKLVLQIHAGRPPDINGFKERIGFIGVTDLKKAPYEEDKKISADLRYYLNKFPTPEDVRIERAHLEAQDQKWLRAQKQAIKKILSAIPKNNRVFMQKLLEFAKTVASSNEARRFLVTKTFRIFRSQLTKLNLEPQTTTLDRFLKAIKN